MLKEMVHFVQKIIEFVWLSTILVLTTTIKVLFVAGFMSLGFRILGMA